VIGRPKVGQKGGGNKKHRDLDIGQFAGVPSTLKERGTAAKQFCTEIRKNQKSNRVTEEVRRGQRKKKKKLAKEGTKVWVKKLS